MFQEIGPWAGFKTDDFVEEKFGGGYIVETTQSEGVVYL